MPADQPALLQLDGATRLIAKPGAAPSRHYILLPASLCRDTAQLADWLAKSACAGNQAPLMRPRRHQ